MHIKNSFQNTLDGIFGFLPNLLGCVLLLIVGFIIAKVVAGIVRKVLQKVGLDKQLRESDASKYVDKVPAPARRVASPEWSSG